METFAVQSVFGSLIVSMDFISQYFNKSANSRRILPQDGFKSPGKGSGSVHPRRALGIGPLQDLPLSVQVDAPCTTDSRLDNLVV
jgi:hypothetical protein